MRIGDRLGGHFVTGHVDGVGTIRQRKQDENTILFLIEAPPEVLQYCVRKGSITIDGISLTINDVSDKAFQVAVIPYTAQVTTLGLKGVKTVVNLECDLIGKYIERLLQTQEPPSRVTQEYLRKKGFFLPECFRHGQTETLPKRFLYNNRSCTLKRINHTIAEGGQ